MKRLRRLAVLGAVCAALQGMANGPVAPLVAAAKAGDLAGVERILGNADVDQAAIDGTTALHWAVYRDDDTMVDLLFNAGARPTLENRYGFPPLYFATVNGNPAILKRLLAEGADPHTTVPGGETVLMTASRTGDPAAIAALLDAGANANAVNDAGQTALMWAAAANNAEAVAALVAGGANLAMRTEKGLDALLFAVRGGRIDATTALLDAGADIGAALATGESALELALVNTHWNLAHLLLDRGADPDQSDAGYTALHRLAVQRAIIRGVVPSEEADIPIGALDITLDLVAKLIALGADVNARMAKDRLKEQRFVNMRDVLFRVGATPFLLAAKEADLELMAILLGSGADPTIATTDGTTPLMVAAGLYSDTGNLHRFRERGWETDVLEAVEICLANDNDVNAVNAVGDTALHGAAYRGGVDVARLLVARGARLDTADSRGLTPLSVATGVYYKMGISAKPETAKFLRTIMQVRGLPTDVLPPDMDQRCLYCYLTQYAQLEAAKKRAEELEAQFALETLSR